jgi:hypothetical protein
MKNIFLIPRFKNILRTFFFVLATLISDHLFSQIDKKTSRAVEHISSYLVDDKQLVDELLQNIAYRPLSGSVLAKEWPKLTAYAKISVAYEAAVRKLGNEGGDLFLNLLQKKTSHYFESAGVMPIRPTNNISKITHLEFHSFPLNDKCSEIIANISHDVRKAIFTLAEYSEAGALGGTQNVMRTYLDLEENIMIEILSKHTTHESVLTEGFKTAGIPPPPTERIQTITRELGKEFESVRADKTLMDFLSKEDQYQVIQKPMAVNPDGNLPSSIKNIKPEEFRTENEEFKQKTIELEGDTRSFPNMIQHRNGLGGVILGNSFSTDLKTKIKYVKWIPYPAKKDARFNYGRFEFVFEDTTVLRLNNVLQEDVFAANQMIFSKNSKYENGRGIGLAGLIGHRLSNGESRYEILLDTTLRYLNLGWAIITTDAYMLCTEQIKEYLEKNYQWDKYKDAFNDWKSVSTNGWKIIDKPLLITKHKFEINVIDSASGSENLVTMRRGYDNYKTNVVEFENLLPAIMQVTPEFRRLKDFTKIITLFRWVKEEKVPIFGLKNFNFKNYVEPPYVLRTFHENSII